MVKGHSMPMYTVVLLYPDYSTDDFGGETYVNAAEGETPQAAAKLVQEMASKANTDIPPEDFRPILVLEGDVNVVAGPLDSYE